jgi:hypothetical protein
MSTDISPKWTCLAPSKAACAWPDCGCDPEATKVIAALVEQGWQAPKEVEAILARSSERSDAARIVEMIDFLRSEEGDCVTILCDYPDFNGQPNCAVECNGEWTRWLHRRYAGDTISDALSAAWLECTQIRAAIEAGQKWWSSTNECPSCKQQYTDGETCKAGRGGCPMGGDF